MNNNFLGIRGLYKTHMDGLKPFNSKSVTYTYIRYTEHNSRGQPIVRHIGYDRQDPGLTLMLINRRRWRTRRLAAIIGVLSGLGTRAVLVVPLWLWSF